MTTVLLVIHLFVTLALIGVVLIQRSEGGGLGIGTAQGMGSFMSGRGTANLLTRTTAILATLFFALSLTLALLNRGTSGVGRSILEAPAASPATTSSPSIPGASGPATGGTTNGGATTGGSPAASSSSGPTASKPGASATPAPAPAPAKPSVPTN